MPRRRILMLMLCATVGGALAGQAYSLTAAKRQVEWLAQPAGWVPFSADLTIVRPDGSRLTGRYYRASNGSVRTSVTLAGSDNTVITIADPDLRVEFRAVKDKWTSRPIDVPPGGLHPAKWRVGMEGLAKYPFRVALRKGDDGSLQSKTGLEAYQYATAAGAMWVIVPELNFHPVVKVFLNGLRMTLSNIETGEPSAELFRPPGGAQVGPAAKPCGDKPCHTSYSSDPPVRQQLAKQDQ